MKKLILSLAFIALTFFNVIATEVEISTAHSVAVSFIAGVPGFSSASDLQVAQIKYASDQQKAYYVFAPSGGKGFIIVSAEDAVFPILAWSPDETFTPENLPENYSGWMEDICRQIAYARQTDQRGDVKTKDAWQYYLTIDPNKIIPERLDRSVTPLITSTWDQGYPYNMQCPSDALGSGGHVVVGCVAIAMAQIMYYWRYPQHGSGSHGYNSDYGYLQANYGNTTYNWNEMTNVATTNSNEIAKLLSHVGISVNMMYSAGSSGAYSGDAVNAFINFFNYSNSVTLLNKDDYSETDWANILMNNLDSGHPMYYHGFGPGGGHAFNVDGYQGSDFFHFNWGWSGSNNGYYYLANLNPGGYTFNEGQGAIVNLVPAANYPYYCNGTTTFTNLAGSFEDGSGPAGDYNNGAGCSWLIAPDDSVTSLTLRFDRFSTEAGQDILTVYDGADANAPILGTFSGNNLPPAIVASGSKLFVTFNTNSSGTAPGWLASYSSAVAEYCQSNVTLTNTSGSLSDGSGPRNYHNNTFCRYKIAPDNAASITLTFQSFSTGDEYDYLSIYDVATQSLVYKFYGSQNPGTITLNTGKIIILFKTDEAGTAPGWQINYVSTPNVNINEAKFISDKMQVYPNPAGENLNINLPSEYAGEYTIKLLSANGAVVYSAQKAFKSTTGIQVDVSRLTGGLYLLQLQNSDRNFMKRIVIE